MFRQAVVFVALLGGCAARPQSPADGAAASASGEPKAAAPGSDTSPALPSPVASSTASGRASGEAAPSGASSDEQLPPLDSAAVPELSAKAWSGKASCRELRMLSALCAQNADRACRDRARALLKDQGCTPPG